VMLGFFLAALLPGLYWDQDAKTAEAVKQAGIERVFVPAGQEPAWKAAGIDVQPFQASKFVKLPSPGVERRMNVAAATSMPWVDANGWRLERDGRHQYYYDVPWRRSALAAAEAYVYAVDAVVHPEPRDLTAFGKMLAFLKSIDQPAMPVMANIAIIDDGSDETGEVLNLLSRRNLLYHIVRAPDPNYDLNVQIGTKDFPKEEALDPSAFATLVRQRLTDEKRYLRIYGSEVVLGKLNGDGQRLRVHLINYGGGKVDGLRVRVLGSYQHGKLAAFGTANPALTDYAQTNGGTEFTIPEMLEYAVVDLEK
jgi:hypothetical protein